MTGNRAITCGTNWNLFINVKLLMVNGVLPYFLTSTGSNGAASMTGRENGLLKKIIQNLSHVICIHCVAHNTELVF